MAAFIACSGKSACTEDGTHFRGCGRTHDEIVRTRDAISALTQVALDKDYDNVEAFARYVASRIVKKLEHAKAVADA